MSKGSAGKLPWTPLSLYDWMKAQISGVDFQTAAGNANCCSTVNGKKYFRQSRMTTTQLADFVNWYRVSEVLGLYLHESRHVAGYGHVTGCAAFPSVTLGCDATYDEADLGAYGIQYWFFAAQANGRWNVGIGCTPFATAKTFAERMAQDATGYTNASRFVTGTPPAVVAVAPYGGPCYPP
jgi:hypothetical protein